MIPAPKLSDALEVLRDRPTPVVGILFAPPHTKIGEENLVPRLAYLHERSGPAIHFICAGYGGYWHESLVPDMQHIGTTRYDDGTVIPWAFSPRFFAGFVRDMEATFTWKYSGEADLILVSSHNDGDPRTSFEDALVYDIDSMIRDKAIPSVGHLFESIIRFAVDVGHGGSAVSLSDREGARTFAESAGDAILSFAPEVARNLWTRGRHYATRNLAR